MKYYKQQRPTHILYLATKSFYMPQTNTGIGVIVTDTESVLHGGEIIINHQFQTDEITKEEFKVQFLKAITNLENILEQCI